MPDVNLDITFEELRQNMLDRVSDEVDKREGSVISTAVSPVSVELQNYYIALKYFLDEVFAVTASRESLIRMAAERGIEPNAETSAIFKAKFNIDVPLGSRFSFETFNYVVTEKIEMGIFKVQCETTGIEPNSFLGNLIPIEYIDNLASAELVELLEPGRDVESTESFRERYLEILRLPATSGNKSHYQIWAKEVNGVGGVKVIPTWNGPGTVKVLIIDMEKRSASSELIADVYEHIETERPIGATVTVESAKEQPISVSAKVMLANGFNLGQVQTLFKQALIKHFADLAFKESYVSYAKIGNLLLDIPGVGDYSELRINNTSANVLLNDEGIAVLGTVTLEV